MEQLKGIKKELGMDTDGKEKLIETFKKKAEKLKMSEAVKKVFDEVKEDEKISYPSSLIVSHPSSLFFLGTQQIVSSRISCF